MPIELRILGGARAGYSEAFEKPVIALGRHPMSDFRFDPKQDLDVSTRHGEIRSADGTYVIVDSKSTNGTFVNGKRIPPFQPCELHDQDVIAFGEHGPTVAVRLANKSGSPIATTVRQEVKPPTDVVSGKLAATMPPRRSTGERVALAVNQQTRHLRIAVIVTVVVLGGLAMGIYLRSLRDKAARDDEIKALFAANAQITKDFETRLQGDTLLTRNLQRHNDSLTRAVRDAKSAQQSVSAQAELKRSQDLQRKFSAMDLPAVREANDGAVVLISTQLGTQTFESTGFSVSAAGLLVTNRHVVLDSTGNATRIRVKFANTRNWLRARIVKVDDDPTIDLALLQIDGAAGPFPRVRQVASAVDTPVGGSIVTIGYPLGTETPMDGPAAKTSLTMGTISKVVSDVLQIDSFVSHGSSGSPVFDQHGHVIGVVYGGPADAAGRIAYAVPAARIAELLKSLR